MKLMLVHIIAVVHLLGALSITFCSLYIFRLMRINK